MRIVWSHGAMRLVERTGVSPAEVNQAVGAEGRRLLLPLEGDDGWRVITDVTGRLVEVWLVRADEGWYEVLGAFEAGMDGRARWRNAQEGELR
ncbi:hypothetical protein HC031_16430 [Planosporangium thailandense]|uniref:Uncharacterized protein n=1 Tax=Planosporangium thailandense TaxID=765197 RepID=A0ABX0Y1J2_9ACTN|nr:hypothetical protein [Planosporangium thailandense]NJC71288.1 hypothetical protein [Planosporangium thailandense]